MSLVRNTGSGPRGAYLKGALVWAEPGQTIEADDFTDEWFDAGKAADAKEAEAPDIVAALTLLDAKNDDHWTGTGLPAVEAVSELVGEKVTRAQIEAAAPDAKRPETDV